MKRNKIIAVDFDGTLCENEWPGIGKPIERNIQRVKAWQAAGAKLILWTNRVTERLSEAVDWCGDHGIVFDAVNENLPEILDAFGTDCRKIYADVYFDDRAVNSSDESNIVRHGRWLPIEADGYADGAPVWDKWECSECGHEHDGEEDTLTDYCPDCGRKMYVDDDSGSGVGQTFSPD